MSWALERDAAGGGVGERPVGLPRLALGGEPLGCHGRREEGSRQATAAGGGVGRGVAGLPRPS
jgi:hypothetical protein